MPRTLVCASETGSPPAKVKCCLAYQTRAQYAASETMRCWRCCWVVGFDDPNSSLDDGACAAKRGTLAEKEVDSLIDWDQVYRSYRKFSQCDDGAIAEGYSDAVSKLLANDWNHFDRLLTLTKTDKPFQQFVLKHIDETVSDAVLSRISSNAPI